MLPVRKKLVCQFEFLQNRCVITTDCGIFLHPVDHLINMHRQSFRGDVYFIAQVFAPKKFDPFRLTSKLYAVKFDERFRHYIFLRWC